MCMHQKLMHSLLLSDHAHRNGDDAHAPISYEFMYSIPTIAYEIKQTTAEIGIHVHESPLQE